MVVLSTEILRLRYAPLRMTGNKWCCASLPKNWACSEAAVDACKPLVRNGMQLNITKANRRTAECRMSNNEGRSAARLRETYAVLQQDAERIKLAMVHFLSALRYSAIFVNLRANPVQIFRLCNTR